MSASFLGDSAVAIGRAELAVERNFGKAEVVGGEVLMCVSGSISRCVGGSREIISGRVYVVPLFEGQGIGGCVAVEGIDRSVEADDSFVKEEEDIAADGVSGTLSLDTEGLIPSIVTEGCFAYCSVEGVNAILSSDSG